MENPAFKPEKFTTPESQEKISREQVISAYKKLICKT